MAPVARHVTGSPAAAVRLPPEDDPDVSFITVAYGTGRIIIETLASLAGSLARSSVTAEVIVVDNPHHDVGARTATDLRLSTSGVILLSPDRNLGFGGGCELGALHARGRVLGFVNPDVTFGPGWIEPLLAVWRPDDATGRAPAIVAPTLLDVDGTIQEIGQTLDARGHTHPNTLPTEGDPLVDVDYASAACWLIRRDDHERIGGFDPAYHPAYFEDVDLALRARRLGGTRVHRDVAVVHHRGHGTPDAPPPATAQHARLLERHPEIRWRQPVPDRS